MKLLKFYPQNGQIRRSNESIDHFSNFWNSFLNEDFGLSNYQSPRVNIIEEDDRFVLEMAVPGIKKENIDLNIEKDILKISHAEKPDAKEKGFNRMEFNYSSFERSFKLSDSVDINKIDAKLEDGILKIFLVKKEELIENAKRAIEIS